MGRLSKVRGCYTATYSASNASCRNVVGSAEMLRGQCKSRARMLSSESLTFGRATANLALTSRQEIARGLLRAAVRGLDP